MILTPGQLTQRSEFYYQLGQLTAAGLGIVAALQRLQRNPPAPAYRSPMAKLLKQIQEGRTFAEALAGVSHWLPAFDIMLIQAGERAGRLEQSFALLADYYRDRARMARQVITGLAYPVFLFHFAVFIFAFVKFMSGGDWLVLLLGVFIPAYAGVLILIYMMQSKHGEAWRGCVEALLRPIPVLGVGRQYLAISRLATALEALLSAGVSIVEAWEMAAAASGSPALKRTVQTWRPLLDSGKTPAEIVTASRRFPDLFVQQYATGEISGQLEKNLRRLHEYYREEGSRKLHTVAKWVPLLIYVGIMLVIAYYIIQFWLGHFQAVQDVMEF